MPAQLVTEQGPTSAAAFLLADGDSVLLGRSPNNGLVLLDQCVSRFHGSITGRAGRFFLLDHTSANGTRLDGRKVECETPLRDGQVIRAGNVMLRFHQVPDEAGHAPPPLSVDPAWLTANDQAVRHLAETILAERNFDLLPLLGDALEDAGCQDEVILDHCRHGGAKHASCWLLDLIVPLNSRSVPSRPTDDSTVMRYLPWSAEAAE